MDSTTAQNRSPVIGITDRVSCFREDKSRVSVLVMVFYPRVRDEHWLRDKRDEGKIVVLEDESMWGIHPADWLVTSHWLRISNITVSHTQNEGYVYSLTNTMEGETARANYLGQSMPGKTIASNAA